jgi:hypothetical protein
MVRVAVRRKPLIYNYGPRGPLQIEPLYTIGLVRIEGERREQWYGPRTIRTTPACPGHGGTHALAAIAVMLQSIS